MAPEHPTVRVQLIEDDVAEILEQTHPFCVVWQDPSVQHVGIRQDNLAAFPNCFSRVTRSIAVVREHSESIVEAFRQILQFVELSGSAFWLLTSSSVKE